jgi:predicted 3-demethylubiquinone-9 3-methyltransferase (glyoxalase superfamily)
MKNLIPHLWFNTEAKEASEFYVSLFPNSKITSHATLHNTPSGDCDIMSFDLAGQPFMAISAGPLFKFNPSISFFVNFDPSTNKKAKEDLGTLWKKLSDGGKALMVLDSYPFSEYYGWVQDKYGVSWQLILSKPEGEPRPFIVPSLMYTGSVAGKAEEATDFYLSVFSPKGDSRRGTLAKYPEGPDKGTVMYTDFMLSSQWLAAMDSAHMHQFVFNEAISLVVPCETQEEIDYYWEKLSADPKAEQCGWCKDKYGVSWQIWPTIAGEMMKSGTTEQIDRVTQAFLPMKKFDIEELKKAYQ